MMRSGVVRVVMVLLLCSFATTAFAADWRFPVGLTYVSGFSDVKDRMVENLEQQGYVVEDEGGIPVGIAFNPHVLFDSGFAVGGGVGPTMFIGGDVDYFGLPVGLDVRQYLFSSSSIAPYLRAGFRYHIASGDDVVSSKPGPYAAVGLEFLRQRTIGFGFEFAYDGATVEFDEYTWWWKSGTEEIEPAGFSVSLFARF